MSEINEVVEPTEEINELPSEEELIQKFADIHKMTYEEAKEKIGAPTITEILSKISAYTLQEIKAKTPMHPNRAQRRALEKKYGKQRARELMDANAQQMVNNTALKLNYIDLIQKFRALNEKKQKEQEENGETIDETD